jgi:hypothetical protein
MYRFACDEEIDLCRTANTSRQDERFGKAARFMCRDKNPREVFVIQSEEAKAEWRRRHPNGKGGDPNVT